MQCRERGPRNSSNSNKSSPLTSILPRRVEKVVLEQVLGRLVVVAVHLLAVIVCGDPHGVHGVHGAGQVVLAERANLAAHVEAQQRALCGKELGARVGIVGGDGHVKGLVGRACGRDGNGARPGAGQGVAARVAVAARRRARGTHRVQKVGTRVGAAVVVEQHEIVGRVGLENTVVVVEDGILDQLGFVGGKVRQL